MSPKTELWKKWMKKLSALTFLFDNIFSSGQKSHLCIAGKLLKDAKESSDTKILEMSSNFRLGENLIIEHSLVTILFQL